MAQAQTKEIIEALRGAINDQSKEGARLPTEAEICEQFGVSRYAARLAYKALIDEGLIQRTPGKGTFVAPPDSTGYSNNFMTVDDLLAVSQDTEMRITRPMHFELNPHAAGILGTGVDSTVMSLELVRFHQGRPMTFSQIYLPPDVGSRFQADAWLPERGSVTFLGLLEKTLDHPVVGVEQTITAVPCPLHVATLLEYRQGDPVLFVTRKFIDSTGRAVELIYHHYNPEMYTFKSYMTRRASS